MSKILRNVLLAVLVIATAAACNRRPLEEPSSAVKISIKVNVKTVTNVNADIRNSVHVYGSTSSLWEPKIKQLDPGTMRVLVYDPDTKKLIGQNFLDSASKDADGSKVFNGTLGISHGNYNFLVYNFDMANTFVSYENNEDDILAYTNEIPESVKTKYTNNAYSKSGEPANFDGLSIREEPEHIIVANEKDVRISPHDTMVVIHTTANTVIDTYYLQIRVKGRKFASSATAIISGLSPSNKIGLNERTVDPSSAVIFDMQQGYDDSLDGENQDVLCAVFNTFGKIPSITSDLKVTFNITDTAGNLLQYNVNLDKVFDSDLARQYHWLIIDDEIIDIPDPGTGGQTGSGGFQPKVDDWETEESSMVL
ncbi:MAG: DUF5119 domain-containing protein [Bacteroidales bacterium]|nr:DUF5119 domain-containing protein [Bacteroidales bacterium]